MFSWVDASCFSLMVSSPGLKSWGTANAQPNFSGIKKRTAKLSWVSRRTVGKKKKQPWKNQTKPSKQNSSWCQWIRATEEGVLFCNAGRFQDKQLIQLQGNCASTNCTAKSDGGYSFGGYSLFLSHTVHLVFLSQGVMRKFYHLQTYKSTLTSVLSCVEPGFSDLCESFSTQ